MANISYPETYQNKQTLPLDGQSLMPVFKGETRPATEHLISGFTERFRMYRSGDWKIVKENNEDWELYNLKKDPTELSNLGTKMSGKLTEMIKKYETYQQVKTQELEGK